MSVFKKIENCYKIFTDEISMIPLIKYEELIGFRIIEHLKEKDIKEKYSLEELKKYNDFKIKELVLYVKEEKINLSQKVLNMGFFEKFKYSLFLTDPLMAIFKKFLIEYFEKYIKMQCGTDYIIRQRKIYNNIFEQIDEMSKKDDWDIFHAQIL